MPATARATVTQRTAVQAAARTVRTDVNGAQMAGASGVKVVKRINKHCGKGYNSPCLCQSTYRLSLAKSNKMDYESVESNEVADITVHARSFSWTVDNMIKSDTASILGESPVHSFTSLINSAIRSSSATEEDLGASPLHTFASAVDMRSIAARLSQVSNATRYFHGFQLFSLAELVAATNNFSNDKKIGTGDSGAIKYRAKFVDGREVVIKRKFGTWSSDNAFVNELETLSRLHHKNLVQLVGFYKDTKETILVYQYMNNGSLFDHLHKLQNSAGLMSWRVRIKVALDAARGIEYLHQYATPPIIHRDIKSSNILLDAEWTAKVSDFGLSLIVPDTEDEEACLSIGAAGTVAYTDPEYYRLQHFTSKSDVYSFGVVLLELLSGYKAIHKSENGVPRNVVDFVVPFIVQDEIHRVLDRRVAPPTPFEIEALADVGYLAADCVEWEREDRPTMSEVVNSLHRALGACLGQPILSSGKASAAATFAEEAIRNKIGAISLDMTPSAKGGSSKKEAYMSCVRLRVRRRRRPQTMQRSTKSRQQPSTTHHSP